MLDEYAASGNYFNVKTVSNHLVNRVFNAVKEHSEVISEYDEGILTSTGVPVKK